MGPDRTDLLLGITCYLYKNPRLQALASLEIYDLDDIDTPASPVFTRFQALIGDLIEQNAQSATTGILPSAAELTQDGARARQMGTSLRTQNRVFAPTPRLAPGYTVEVLRPIYRWWDAFDHTRDESILLHRYETLVQWHEHSCGPDAILFAGIHSGAIIRCGDAITFRDFVKLPALQKYFRDLLTLRWGTLPQVERDQRRNMWSDALRKELKKRGWQSQDGYTDVADLAQLSFSGVPTFTFTKMRAHQCCSRPIVTSQVKAQRHTVIAVVPTTPSQTLGSMVSDILAPQLPATKEICKHCGSSNAKYFWIVVDRLPPMLIVTITPGIQIRTRSAKVYDDIVIRYCTTQGWNQNTYTVEGVILATGPAALHNHFTVRWKGRGDLTGRVLHYDSYKSPKPVLVPNWAHNLRASDAVRTVFYRMSIA